MCCSPTGSVAVWAGLWLLTSVVVPLQAKEAVPRAEVLRLVPQRMTFVVLVQDLRRHWTQLAESPFAEQFLQTSLGKALVTSPELRKLAEIDRQIQQHLGIDFRSIRDDLLGDAVLLAFEAADGINTTEDKSLAIVWVRSTTKCQQFIDKLNQIQLANKEIIAIQSRKYRRQEYFHRRNQQGEDEFYLFLGNRLVWCSQEEMIRAVIDQDATVPPVEETQPPLIKEFQRLGIESAGMLWWLNPRHFDRDLQTKAQSAQGGEKAFLQTFWRYWKALDSLALFVKLDEEIELGIAIHLRRQDLPKAAQRFFASAEQASPLWNQVPTNAFLALGHRFDWSALTEAIGEFLPTEHRLTAKNALEQTIGPILGKDMLAEVMQAVGPDGIFWLAPPLSSDAKDWVPRAVAALRVRTKTKERADPIEKALRNAMQSLGVMVRFWYNSLYTDQIAIEETQQDGVWITYLLNEKGFPPNLRPAFAFKNGYLIVGNHPDTLLAFQPGPHSSLAGEQVPYLRFRWAEWRTYWKRYREPISLWLAPKIGTTPEEFRSRWDRLSDALELVDEIELGHRVLADRSVSWTLRIRCLHALRK